MKLSQQHEETEDGTGHDSDDTGGSIVRVKRMVDGNDDDLESHNMIKMMDGEHGGATKDAVVIDTASDSGEDAPDDNDSWTPAQANFPEDNEKHPLLSSIVAMRTVKGYVNGENLVPMTTYSFIVTTGGHGSAPNLVNAMVFVLQMASFLAVVTYTFDFNNANNPCQFPANVESSVRASQFLSLVYSICVQGGVISTLYTFRNGYDEEMLRKSFPDCAQNGLKVRWYISMGLILLLGLLAQLLTFVLIMQSSTVLDVLLNYAAVSFISTIDDRLFYLGKRGWLGQQVEKQVRLVCLADEVDPKPRWYHRLAHTLALLAIFGGLVASWVVVVDKQTNGTYLPNKIMVQFSDEVNPALGTFSGLFTSKYRRDRIFSSDKSVYSDLRSDRAHFGYCETSGSWTFQYDVMKDEFDACSWSATSLPTESFDIITTAVSQWSAKNPDGRTIPMSRASIASSNCSTDPGICGKHGSCIAGECVCESGWFGLFCSFREPCPTLELDSRRGDSLGSAERSWSTRYEILRFGNNMALVHDFPVYVTATNPPGRVADGEQEEFDVIFYNGRRWAISFSTEFYNPSRDGDLESYLEGFHAQFSDFRASFLSEPITPILESPSPIGIRFFFADLPLGGMQAATKQELDAGFVCAECSDEINPCFYGGVCEDSGVCKCSEGSKGSLCENPPVGNGRCDPFFNKLQFNMDGGDCCRATCISSPDYTCGKDETGFLDTGFFFCESGDPLRTEIIRGEPLAETGRIVAISENGYLMATTTKKTDIAIYDKRGAIWDERFVLNVCRTAVRAMDMSGGPFVSNPFVTETPFILVASCKDSSEPVLYYCRDGNDCMTTTLDKPEEADETFGSQVAVSSDGGVIAVSSLGNSPGSSLVSIFRADRSESLGVEWSGGSDEVVVPMKYYKNPVDGNVTVPFEGDPNVTVPSEEDLKVTVSSEEDLNVTLVRNVTLNEVPTPQFILSTSLSNVDALALAASDYPDSLLSQVHYYQWNGSIWEERGVPLEVQRCSQFAPEDMVQLSEDGKILLVSDGTHVSVFKWDEESNDWALRGDPIQQSECSIKTVDLSASGNEIAVDALYDNGEEVVSRILTFNWSDSEWERRERWDDSIELKGDSHIKLALSYHGRELAIGRPYFPADHSGAVQTFEFPRSDCEQGFERFRITMTIQPTITKWSLVSLIYNDTFVSSGGGPYFFPNFPGATDVDETHHDGATVVEELCIPDQRCSNFTLYPPGFGGAAFVLDKETRLQLQNEEVYVTMMGTMDPSECELVGFPTSTETLAIQP